MSFPVMSSANIETPDTSVRFGRTVIHVVCGNWAGIPLDTIVLPANRRGLLGVNITGGVRVDGGLEVEREAMALAPLTLGTAIVTGSGTLASHGISHVIHGVVADQLGDSPREMPLRQAVIAAMRQADAIKGRHLGVLPFGSGMTRSRVSREQSVPIMIEEMVGHLRRSSSRIESIAFICNSQTEAREVQAMLERMRRDWWGLRV